MRLILIRHGRTLANERHLYCGSTDLPLSEAGRAELRAIRSSLPELKGARVLTSGARRCEETLFELYGDIPHETDRDLWEMDFGAFEMRSYEELKGDPEYIAWITGDNEANVTPGGESGELMRRRALAALNRVLAEGRPAAMITHGGVIAAIMDSLFPEAGKNRYQWQPEPGRGYVVDTCTAGGGGKWSKISKNMQEEQK